MVSQPRRPQLEGRDKIWNLDIRKDLRVETLQDMVDRYVLCMVSDGIL
jgi:hypothetical protein